uniref:Cyclin-like domain-containing protein n=1 Tax=Arion vulgaris TaxID=1028688 RepID=A0A0B7A2I1_9EUPU
MSSIHTRSLSRVCSPQIIVMYLEVLGSTGKKQLVQCAWNFMNDSLRSDVFMRFHSESIACACIYLAARQCQVPLPNNPPWFWLFAVNEDEIQHICMSILRLYSRPKPNFEHLEKIVDELKKKQQAAKSKARGLVSDLDTPNSSSRQNSPKVFSPNPTSGQQLSKKGKDKADMMASNLDGDAGSDKSDHNTSHWQSGKKDGRHHSDESDRSGLSKSGSSGSHSSELSRQSRSPRSDSPPTKKRRQASNRKKVHSVESFGRSKHRRKYKSLSRSASRSPVHSSKNAKKFRQDDFKDSRDSYKDKDYYHDRDYKERDYHRDEYYKSRSVKDRDYHKDRRSYTPEKDRHRSRKHRSNGHRDSPVREKFDKHRR